ncbi:glucose-1-phosphate adenylyltransferase [Anaerotalea alkaliphila]|uniref:Glucose-1-phosphate adenylyltransferase n=1 Tax=Anaerotalea alkaliphila TaxID=2662126 RepID=A0A7X5HU74_9FIRM|nr:glucose-1-phosphate adenylyltransferase [Anaerotalea alkaliphila]NDL66735.1 glucose-1-phosphate adenylyltransferase [Anaerotalea alkaliphila]
MKKKEIIAMLLAGGQGSRLGVLTTHLAKPAVSFAGKYKIIDFALSNCINSGIDTVGVVTQYQPLQLNRHIGIGIPWDLDKSYGGVAILPPYVSKESNTWYTGTANAVYQNIPYVAYYNPEYVLILSGDHIYKMDYEMMLNYHKKRNADCTIAVIQVEPEEASRFGIINTDEENRIVAFEEKPKEPKSRMASMGIYIFKWKALREALVLSEANHDDSDFGKHIIPYLIEQKYRLFAYQYEGFWRDVGTLDAYWETNLELVGLVPDFNLYEAYWKIYTKNEILPPQYIAPGSYIEKCILGEGTEIYGSIYNCVIGSGVIVEAGAVVRDSILMSGVTVGEGTRIDKSIIGENTCIGKGVRMGEGEFRTNGEYPQIYVSDITVVGENSSVPDGVSIGKNCALYGQLVPEDFPEGRLESGSNRIKEEVEQ